MWRHRPWVGPYFPRSTRPGAELAAYVTWCNAVEGNTSFYALPSESSVASWAEVARPPFHFLFKLPRAITHDRRLRSAGPDVTAFCRRMSPLGPCLGPTSVQLPASFGPDQLPVLDVFLTELPTADFRWAVEVRHPDFCDGAANERRLNDTLAAHGVERIIFDSRGLFAGPSSTPEEIEGKQRKPNLPVRPVAIGPEPIVRFVGQADPESNPEFWRPWITKLARWIDDGREPHFFVHTPDNAVSPELARRVHGEVADLVPLQPLPRPATGAETDQLHLL